MIDSEQHNYCRNLVEVNKKQRVVTTQPIYNQQGVLLLAKGHDLDEQRSQVLLHHKLMKPLEECVGIASSLSARQLFEFMNKFAANVPGLHVVTANEEYQKLLRQMCIFYERHALLQQNLTVLALRARTIYYHGIFSALAGLAIAQKLGLTMKEFQTVFIGGLFHDVGFLYLSSELIDKTQGFSADEWKALQAHPLIAQRFLNMVPQLPQEVGMAIADHHERIDGTGVKCNGLSHRRWV
jgi:HD-GYP domain-containing protein (c-di-GMP phosphodiesterase class II)